MIKPRSQSAYEGMVARGGFPMSSGGSVPLSPTVTVDRTIKFQSKGSIEVSNSPELVERGSKDARLIQGDQENLTEQKTGYTDGSWMSRLFGWKTRSHGEDLNGYA